jgi:tryptophan-rich sensory protein
MKKIKWKVLIGSLVIVYLVALIGSIFTSSGVDTEWYEQIKPSITPPNWIFPVVWNILFFLIALSLYFSWINSKNKNQKKKIAFVFVINLLLNILWSFFFFKIQNPVASFYELFVLWFSIIAMIYITGKTSKLAAWLLVPYLLWVLFAGVLNYLMI